jgi:hypothetical protein
MYELTVRVTEPTAQNAYIGHAGVTLSDLSKDDHSHYDFGSINAGGKYSECSSAFRRVASGVSTLGCIVGYAGMGFVSGAIASSGDFQVAFASALVGMAYSAFNNSSKGVIAKCKNDELKSDGGKAYKIPISETEYNRIQNTIDSKGSWYTLGINNCVGFTKDLLREAGIKMPRQMFNHPKRLMNNLEAKSITPVIFSPT